MPIQEQSLEGDPQDRATLPLTEPIEKMEIVHKEETEKSEHLKQKLEGDPQEAKVPLTETVQS